MIVTAEDVPGATYGLIGADQPVLRPHVLQCRVRRSPRLLLIIPGPPGACVEAIIVEYEVLDFHRSRASHEAAPIHQDGSIFRHQRIVRSRGRRTGDVVVEGVPEIGIQDQAFLGLESARVA